MIKTFDELREELLAFMEQQQEEAEGEDQGQGRQGGEQQGGVQGGVVQVTPEAKDRELSMQREQGGRRRLQPQASEEPMEGDTRRDGAGVASSSVRSSIGHAQDGEALSGRAGSAAAEPKRMPTERQLVVAGRTDIVSVSEAAVGGGVWPVMECKWHVLHCCQTRNHTPARNCVNPSSDRSHHPACPYRACRSSLLPSSRVCHCVGRCPVPCRLYTGSAAMRMCRSRWASLRTGDQRPIGRTLTMWFKRSCSLSKAVTAAATLLTSLTLAARGLRLMLQRRRRLAPVVTARASATWQGAVAVMPQQAAVPVAFIVPQGQAEG